VKGVRLDEGAVQIDAERHRQGAGSDGRSGHLLLLSLQCGFPSLSPVSGAAGTGFRSV
jgi:hypothetical protein